MNPISKLRLLFKARRDSKEIELWFSSLIPLMVAFVLFVMLLLPMKLADKDIIYAIGMASGFTGIQTYWIMRGWRRNEGLTVVLGVIGIVMVLAAAWLYVYELRMLMPFYERLH